jgi:hypothetical protein
MSLVGLLVALLVVVLVVWALGRAPIPPDIARALQIVLVLLFVLWVVVSVFGGGPVIRVG